jgi:sulfite exporter TauE/SafE
MLTVCAAGLLAGLLHVFSGPDHLAALAPLSLAARRRAWIVGMRWGLGHSTGVIAVAALAFGLRRLVNLESLEGWGERLVGATLILLGLWGLRTLFRNRLHVHSHEHEGERHAHVHVHAPGEDHAAAEAHVHGHAAFWVGTLHGLAGTAHLLGVLPALALPTWRHATGYLATFAAGTILAMTVFAGAMGFLSPGRTERGVRLYRWALGGASILCALVGAAWIILPLAGVKLP